MAEERLKPLPVAKEVLTKRTDLTPLIESLLSGKHKFQTPAKELRKRFDVQNPSIAVSANALAQANAIWNRTKPERNAIIAILISELWNDPHFEQARAEALARDELIDSYFDTVANLFNEQLSRWAGRIEPSRRRDKRGTLVRKLYKHYELQLEFAEGNGLLLPGSDRPAVLIQTGIGTAIRVLHCIMGIVPQLVKEKGLPLSPADMLGIIERAQAQIAVPLAHMHEDITVPILNAILDETDANNPRFRIEFFDIVEKDGRHVLVMKPEKLRTMRTELGPFSGPIITSEKTDCPAAYPVGGKENVIRAFIDWSMELAKKRYLPTLLTE